MADQRVDEQPKRVQRQDHCDREGRIVGIDRALGGDDRQTPQIDEPIASRLISLRLRLNMRPSTIMITITTTSSIAVRKPSRTRC
jgi:hypothetical protein